MVKGSMFDTFYYQGSPIKDWPGDLASEEAEAALYLDLGRLSQGPEAPKKGRTWLRALTPTSLTWPRCHTITHSWERLRSWRCQGIRSLRVIRMRSLQPKCQSVKVRMIFVVRVQIYSVQVQFKWWPGSFFKQMMSRKLSLKISIDHFSLFLDVRCWQACQGDVVSSQ